MLYIGRLDRAIFACVAGDIVTDEVVITDKQIEHIFAGHPQAEHARVLSRLTESVTEPDYILRDAEPRTAVILKRFAVEGERYRVILKLAVEDERHPMNSVITAFYISEKKWNKYLRNKEVLYKSPGL